MYERDRHVDRGAEDERCKENGKVEQGLKHSALIILILLYFTWLQINHSAQVVSIFCLLFLFFPFFFSLLKQIKCLRKGEGIRWGDTEVVIKRVCDRADRVGGRVPHKESARKKSEGGIDTHGQTEGRGGKTEVLDQSKQRGGVKEGKGGGGRLRERKADKGGEGEKESERRKERVWERGEEAERGRM